MNVIKIETQNTKMKMNSIGNLGDKNKRVKNFSNDWKWKFQFSHFLLLFIIKFEIWP